MKTPTSSRQMKKNHIILVSVKNGPFIRKDIEMLEEQQYHVDAFFMEKTKGLDMIFSQIRLLGFLLLNVCKARAIIVWFVDYHAFLPSIMGKLFNKKVLALVGGFDAVALPSFRYGVFYKRNFRSWIVRHAYKMADYILPVHESLIEGINYYADPAGKGFKTGVRSYVKGVRGEFHALPTGYNPDFWKVNPTEARKGVVTIASIKSLRTFQIKGIDLIYEIAAQMPDVPFTVIGVSGKLHEELRSRAPENVELKGFVDHPALPQHLSRYKVYAQLSLTEGLPNALCEAMLCECIPVGSDVNGIPYAIGDAGFILKKRDPHRGAEIIEKALNSDEKLGKEARQRIRNLFPVEARKNKLTEILEK